MRVKALNSFSGPSITMYKGEVREVSDKALLTDLTKAGYIKEQKSVKKVAKVSESK